MFDSSQANMRTGGDSPNSGNNAQLSSIIALLARELGKYVTLFLFASIVGSYTYNSMFFYGVDGEFYFNTFLPLLSYNDYISTMFSFVPPAAMIFTCALVGKSLLEALLRWGSAVLEQVSEVNPYSNVNKIIKNIAFVFAVKNFLWLIGLFVLYFSVTVSSVQPKYNWGLLSVSIFSLAFYVKFHNRVEGFGVKGRVVYAMAFLTMVVGVLSAIVGFYRLELAMQGGKKTISLTDNGNSIQVSAARSLEKGVFFIVEKKSGGYVAHFKFYEGGQHLCANVVSEENDLPFWRRVIYKWPSSEDRRPDPKRDDCNLAS